MSSGSTEVTIVWCDSLFTRQPHRVSTAPGRTVAELLRDLPLRPRLLPYVTAYIGDRPVPRRLWSQVRPRGGQQLLALPTPQGGGGGNQKVLRNALLLAVIAASAAAPYAAPTAWGAVSATGGLTLTGSLISAGVGIGTCLSGPLVAGVPVPR